MLSHEGYGNSALAITNGECHGGDMEQLYRVLLGLPDRHLPSAIAVMQGSTYSHTGFPFGGGCNGLVREAIWPRSRWRGWQRRKHDSTGLCHYRSRDHSCSCPSGQGAPPGLVPASSTLIAICTGSSCVVLAAPS